MASPEWMEKALCKGKAQDLWYPPLDAPNPTVYYSIARQVCERCPVWDYCLEAAAEEEHGMWAGLTEKERRYMDRLPKSIERPHGSVSRYRQGCTCDRCEDAAYEQRSPIDLSVIPNVGESIDDIDNLRCLVFSSLGEPLTERGSASR